MIIASWNVNSIRARVEQVTAWMKAHNPDVLLLQELKGTEFLVDLFNLKGGDATERQHRCRFFAISTTLMGDDADSHARFLEVIVKDIRIANIYLPNGNPVGSEKFAYKLAWMDRLGRQLALWLQSDTPTVVGGDFNVIPENIDCHKPASWIHDALFQPEPREWYRAYLSLGYLDAFRTCIRGKVATSRSGIISGKPSSITAESESTTSSCRRNSPLGLRVATSTKVRAHKRNRPTTPRSFFNWAKNYGVYRSQFRRQVDFYRGSKTENRN